LSSQSSFQDLPVRETNQTYPKSRTGNDAFVIDLAADFAIKPGAMLTTVNHELQGIVVSSTLSTAAESTPGRVNRHLAIPAVHIEKLINEYRATAK
jgi:hypothetical protein